MSEADAYSATPHDYKMRHPYYLPFQPIASLLVGAAPPDGALRPLHPA
ncbi:hypothetical protein ACX80Z_07410 [Arthrobacter sp. TMT4-20]